MSKAKNVLIISGIKIFPPESGGQCRTANIALSLANNGDKVRIYSLTARKKDYFYGISLLLEKSAPNLEEYVDRNPLFAFLQYLSYKIKFPPFWITFVLSFFVPGILRKLIKDSDVLIIDFPFLYPVFKKRLLRKNHVQILNMHNAEYELWKGWKSRIVKRVEQKALIMSRSALFCTQQDCDKLSKLLLPKSLPVGHNYLILPNGLNLGKVGDYQRNREEIRMKLIGKANKHIILFSASYYVPNIKAFEFLKNFADKNRTFLIENDIVLLVVGSVANIPYSDQVLVVTSKVDDVYPYFAASDAAINPVSEGSGSNVKMFEYMAFHLPILSSVEGLRGLNLTPNRNCLVFDYENLHTVLSDFISKHSSIERKIMGLDAYEQNRHLIDMGYNIKKIREALW